MMYQPSLANKLVSSMPDSAFLALWLEGPLQSWGASSKFYNRTTLDFPTKSAMYGMVLAAMGRSGEQQEFLKSLNGSLDVFACSTSKNGEISKLEDFQMIGAAYDSNDPWGKLMTPKKGDGRSPTGVTGAKLVYKEYLECAAFGVVMEIPIELKDKIVNAFQEPVFDLYLGRKCCIPSDFILKRSCQTKEEAITEIEAIIEQKALKKVFTVKDGRDENADDILTLKDKPLSFGLDKSYLQREVSIFFC